MVKLSFFLFFNKYIFCPLTQELSRKEQNIALALSIISGVMTAGLLHLSLLFSNLIRFKGRVIPLHPYSLKTANVHKLSLKFMHVESVAENRIQEFLKNTKNYDKVTIQRIIQAIKEIVSRGTLCDQALPYNDEGIAYIKKNSEVPVTLEVQRQGHVFVHFKSKSIKEEIGRACQKVVYRTINQSGEVFAASVIKEADKKLAQSTFDAEKKAMLLFKDCPYVVKGIQAHVYTGRCGEEKHGLIFEYCQGQARAEFLNRLLLHERWMFFLHILEAVEAMHDKGYSHCDLHPGNILYKKVEGGFEPRVIDFGVILPLNKEFKGPLRSAFPAPEYFHPETSPGYISARVDIWALGVYAAQEILNLPVAVIPEDSMDQEGPNQNKKYAAKADWSKASSDHEKFIPILKKMLARDPADSPSLHEVMQEIKNSIESLSSKIAS